MTEVRHLPNAPITEALIDFQIEARLGLTFAQLGAALTVLDFGYYLKNPISQGLIAFRFKMGATGPEPNPEASQHEQIGLRLHSSDEKYVAQFRVNGFTLSRLPPYEDWETLQKEAQRLWTIYHQRLGPVKITRIATRYINNLQLPLSGGVTFQTYLRKLVDIPDEMPQLVAGFFQRFQVVDPESRAHVVLAIAMDQQGPADAAPVILDIDAFMNVDLVPISQQLWEQLSVLHDLKNRCFFGILTEKAIELYK